MVEEETRKKQTTTTTERKNRTEQESDLAIGHVPNVVVDDDDKTEKFGTIHVGNDENGEPTAVILDVEAGTTICNNNNNNNNNDRNCHHNNNDNDFEKTCSICLMPYQEGDEVSWSPNDDGSKCPHEFHTECIRAWLLRHKECPMCRKTFLNNDDDNDNNDDDNDGGSSLVQQEQGNVGEVVVVTVDGPTGAPPSHNDAVRDDEYRSEVNGHDNDDSVVDDDNDQNAGGNRTDRDEQRLGQDNGLENETSPQTIVANDY